MSKYVTLEKTAYEKMCGLIRESYSVADAILDDSVGTNSTYSSKKIEEKLENVDAKTVNGHTVEVDVPENAIFTDTVYDDTDIKKSIENKVEKEEGKGLFSGKYEDLTGTPTIPSIEGLVSEESLNTTLEDYLDVDDLKIYHSLDEIGVPLPCPLYTLASAMRENSILYLYQVSTSTITDIPMTGSLKLDCLNNNPTAEINNTDHYMVGYYIGQGQFKWREFAKTDHEHDDAYLSKSGGEIEGDLVVNKNTSIKETSYVITSEGSIVDIYNLSDSGNNQYSGIVGGKNNKIVSSDSTIGAGIICGENNQINASQNDHAVILGGRNNTIGGSNTSDTAIIAGQSNKITSSQTNSTIIGGTTNTIKALGSNNAILGGSNNNITTSPDGCTIIGGSGNTISYAHSPSTGRGGSIIGCDNTLTSAEGVIVGWKNATSKSTRNILIGYANGYTSSSVADTQGISVYIGADNHAESHYTKEQFIIGSHLSISTSATGIHTLMGSYNQETTESSPLIFGGGYVDENDSTVKQNLMRLTSEGQLYYKTGMGAGADYAEFFEWSDGNPNKEDRCGLFVTFDFDKQYDYDNTQELPHIRVANEGEYILGVISGNPSFIGNADENWKKRFLQDDFGRNILKEVQVPITELQEIETGEYRTEIEYDENDNEIEVQVPITELKEIETGEYRTEYRNVLNPEYDETKEYESRSSRKEWDASGMLGVLSVRDDGTCEVGKFCKCGTNGVATLAEERGIDTFLVLRRVSDNVIKIVFK